MAKTASGELLVASGIDSVGTPLASSHSPLAIVMISAGIKEKLKEIISDRLGFSINSLEFMSVGGGSINETFRILINKKDNFFCKFNSVQKFPLLFEKEKNGLELLGSYYVIRVPKVYSSFQFNGYQVLLLEWIEQGTRNDNFWKSFAEQLAALHSITSTSFGLGEDNYMGALPQYNKHHSKWVDFFIHQRLEPQINLAVEKKLFFTKQLKQFERLFDRLPEIFPMEPPSLIHGDLWSGNYICDTGNRPVLIDPAVYFGNRAMDLAMSNLFGGFHKHFYDSYSEINPFPGNYSKQWEVCNLYPLLIHLNLFGYSYMGRINETINQY